MKTLLRTLRYPLLGLMALVLLFEEWGWEPLQAQFAKLARLPLWARLEARIARLPPWAALLAFGIPFVALLPFKILALYLFAQHQVTLGLAVLISAKLAGTALLARLFHLLQPSLMQLAWFARWYPRWKAWKDALLDRVRASPPWQAYLRRKTELRAWWGRFSDTWTGNKS
jgi:hypothetical protein